MHDSAPRLDPRVPALLVKVGRYPQHHGAVGVARSLGRAGVPVYAMVEDRYTPTALSRYVTGRFVWPTSGLEQPRQLVAALVIIGRAIGVRSVAVATDDEAAVLLAEHAPRLSEHFLLPPVPRGLPRRLAGKAALYELCVRHGVPAPRSWAPADHAELLAVGREWGYPLVLKNRDPWTRLSDPAVPGTVLVSSEADLLDRCPHEVRAPLLVQEYLPARQCEDWITHLYCAADGATRVVFTGVKVRSWPPGAGVTTRARAVANPELAALAIRLCRRIGYSGVADLDWRLDLRDGRYKLLDFNPRTGAQFRLFESERGVDVVRALHLDLSGRPIPVGRQVQPRSYAVGQLDLPSALAWAAREHRLPESFLPRRHTERAWLCHDDPVPALAEAVRFTGTVASRLAAEWRRARA
ncbi:ATP-grasp domain-containing protein [Streptantibioticus parmotrematis]|uniref:carboxylate--amine ligase n=1 Tax=Streptantibioticus parmotrematis TaxID=2873249 RepID=UPI0033D164E8